MPARGGATAPRPGRNFASRSERAPCFEKRPSVRRTQESGSREKNSDGQYPQALLPREAGASKGAAAPPVRRKPIRATMRIRDGGGIRECGAWLGGVCDLRLFLCERSSMPPVTGHNKFGDGLACPGSHLSILQRLRQGSWIARVTDGDRSDRFPTRGNPKGLARFFRIESRHLMDGQSLCGRFHREQGGRGTGVVLSVAVGGVVFREGQVCHGD